MWKFEDIVKSTMSGQLAAAAAAEALAVLTAASELWESKYHISSADRTARISQSSPKVPVSTLPLNAEGNPSVILCDHGHNL
jgi:hypothetical protein